MFDLSGAPVGKWSSSTSLVRKRSPVRIRAWAPRSQFGAWASMNPGPWTPCSVSAPLSLCDVSAPRPHASSYTNYEPNYQYQDQRTRQHQETEEHHSPNRGSSRRVCGWWQRCLDLLEVYVSWHGHQSSKRGDISPFYANHVHDLPPDEMTDLDGNPGGGEGLGKSPAGMVATWRKPPLAV